MKKNHLSIFGIRPKTPQTSKTSPATITLHVAQIPITAAYFEKEKQDLMEHFNEYRKRKGITPNKARKNVILAIANQLLQPITFTSDDLQDIQRQRTKIYNILYQIRQINLILEDEVVIEENQTELTNNEHKKKAAIILPTYLANITQSNYKKFDFSSDDAQSIGDALQHPVSDNNKYNLPEENVGELDAMLIELMQAHHAISRRFDPRLADNAEDIRRHIEMLLLKVSQQNLIKEKCTLIAALREIFAHQKPLPTNEDINNALNNAWYLNTLIDTNQLPQELSLKEVSAVLKVYLLNPYIDKEPPIKYKVIDKLHLALEDCLELINRLKKSTHNNSLSEQIIIAEFKKLVGEYANKRKHTILGRIGIDKNVTDKKIAVMEDLLKIYDEYFGPTLSEENSFAENSMDIIKFSYTVLFNAAAENKKIERGKNLKLDESAFLLNENHSCSWLLREMQITFHHYVGGKLGGGLSIVGTFLDQLQALNELTPLTSNNKTFLAKLAQQLTNKIEVFSENSKSGSGQWSRIFDEAQQLPGQLPPSIEKYLAAENKKLTKILTQITTKISGSGVKKKNFMLNNFPEDLENYNTQEQEPAYIGIDLFNELDAWLRSLYKITAKSLLNAQNELRAELLTSFQTVLGEKLASLYETLADNDEHLAKVELGQSLLSGLIMQAICAAPYFTNEKNAKTELIKLTNRGLQPILMRYPAIRVLEKILKHIIHVITIVQNHNQLQSESLPLAAEKGHFELQLKSTIAILSTTRSAGTSEKIKDLISALHTLLATLKIQGLDDKAKLFFEKAQDCLLPWLGEIYLSIDELTIIKTFTTAPIDEFYQAFEAYKKSSLKSPLQEGSTFSVKRQGIEQNILILDTSALTNRRQ